MKNCTLILFLILISTGAPAWAGSQCDLTDVVAVQLPDGHTIALKNLFSSFSLVVPSTGCVKSAAGDGCVFSMDIAALISEGWKKELAAKFKVPAAQLKYVKKLGNREPAAAGLSVSGQNTFLGRCL